MPVQVEFHHRGGNGQDVVESLVEIEWGAPLADELFQAPSFDASWKVESRREVCYSDDQWRCGLKVEIGPLGESAIITQRDIKGIRAAEITNTVKRQTVSVAFDLTDDAWRRAKDYHKVHVSQPLSVTMNGQPPFEVNGTQLTGAPRLETKTLSLSLEEFERNYLPPKPNGSKATPPTR